MGTKHSNTNFQFHLRCIIPVNLFRSPDPVRAQKPSGVHDGIVPTTQGNSRKKRYFSALSLLHSPRLHPSRCPGFTIVGVTGGGASRHRTSAADAAFGFL